MLASISEKNCKESWSRYPTNPSSESMLGTTPSSSEKSQTKAMNA